MKALLDRKDAVIIIMMILSLLTACIILSQKSYLWMDELLGYNLVTDPSFFHMLKALADKADGGLPLYYIIVWFWVKVFGSSELALRIFSSICFSLGIIVVWKVLRGVYNFWPVALGCTFTLFTSKPLLLQNSTARYYGLLFLFCALGLRQFQIIIRKGKRCSWKDLLINSSIHAGIVLTHIYGFIYSGIFLLTYMVCDYQQSIFRPKVYLSIFLGWAFFLPWLGPFLNQADLVIPHNYKLPPTITDIAAFYVFKGVPATSFFILALFGFQLFLSLKNGNNHPKKVNILKDIDNINYISLNILGLLLIVIPPIMAWIMSKIVSSIFEYRYMIPSLLGWVIIMTSLTNSMLPIFSETEDKVSNNLSTYRKTYRKIFYIMIIIILIIPVTYAIVKKKEKYDNIVLRPDLPLVINNAGKYLPRVHYYKNNKRYFYVLDWEASVNNKNTLAATVHYKLLEAIKRNYDHFNIMQAKEFLAKYDTFLVYDDQNNPKDNKWDELTIKNNPNYRYTRIADKIILVERLNKSP